MIDWTYEPYANKSSQVLRLPLAETAEVVPQSAAARAKAPIATMARTFRTDSHLSNTCLFGTLGEGVYVPSHRGRIPSLTKVWVPPVRGARNRWSVR